jgi:hypothetical protein
VIAVDSSSWIAYFAGAPGADAEAVERALAARQACLPPVVRTELLSDPALPRPVAELLLQVPLLDPDPGYWERAGRLRAKLLASRRKARVADVLIAQSCIDHEVALITRDRDFERFARSARLRLLP